MRALIFDMDGLLIDSEDAYTLVTNQILHENGRPSLPWPIKAQLQGRPGPAAGRIFRQWAQLPIPEEQFMARQRQLQRDAFKNCKPLPGVQKLLELAGKHAKVKGGHTLHLALATSSHRNNYEIKTARMTEMFSVFPEEHLVVGDDPRIPKGRGKPLPDIYLLALKTINESLKHSEKPVLPEECLVFEDSVPGVESGRRAGMRVVWCPHEGLLGEYEGREKQVLAGRTGVHNEEEALAYATGEPLPGSPGQVGEVDDGWAELVRTLEEFDWAKHGIDIGGVGNGTEARGGIDEDGRYKRADAKSHAAEEGKRFGDGNL